MGIQNTDKVLAKVCEKKVRFFVRKYETVRRRHRCHRCRCREKGASPTPASTLEQAQQVRQRVGGRQLVRQASRQLGTQIHRNSARMEKRFEKCGFYDETSEH